MRLLALDTSTTRLTVAVVEDGHVRASIDREVGIGHGEALAAAVRSVTEAGRPDALGVGVGPGPFTSLRVGVATAAALADAWGVPAYPVCSLDLLRAPETVVVQDARRKEVYAAFYDASGDRIGEPRVLTPAALAADVAGRRVVGAGALRYAELLRPDLAAEAYPAAARMWSLVERRLAAGAPGEPLVPMYLRRPDAVESAAARPRVLQ